MKIVIIAGGTPPSIKLLKKCINNAIIICADSGGDILFKHKILPQYLIGDLDSIAKSSLNYFIENNVIIEKYPVEKNLTDAQLALQKAITIGADEIIFLGCIGGKKIDHFLGALGLLLECSKLNIKASFKDDIQTITLLSNSAIISGKPGASFSLQAYCAVVKNLTISGCKFTLQNYDLKLGDARTLSNEFIKTNVAINYTNGKLLLINSFIE